jgi:hypothetical protein
LTPPGRQVSARATGANGQRRVVWR